MATKYLEEFASTAALIANAPDRGTKKLGIGSVAEAIYINRAGAAVEIPVKGLVSLTANTSLTKAAHADRTLVLNKSTGATVTLPAASGSGDRYEIFIGTALASGSYIVQVANANDYLRGVCWETQDGGDTSLSLDTADTGTVATESDTITMDGSTKGGVVGTCIYLRDIAANVWYVEMQNKATGSEVTPFSVAV